MPQNTHEAEDKIRSHEQEMARLKEEGSRLGRKVAELQQEFKSHEKELQWWKEELRARQQKEREGQEAARRKKGSEKSLR